MRDNIEFLFRFANLRFVWLDRCHWVLLEVIAIWSLSHRCQEIVSFSAANI